VLAVAGLAAWSLLSVLWSPGSAQPVLAFERIAVYVLALVAVLLVSRPGCAVGLLAGVLAGTVLVSGYGLFTYAGAGRLSGPVGYANATGILAVIGLLLALGLAANTRGRHGRALAFGVLPLLAATVELTFSRGSWAALAAGACVAIVVDVRRLHLLAVLMLGLAAPALLLWLVGSPVTGLRLGVVVTSCTALALTIGAALPVLERARLGARGRRVIGAGVLVAASAALVGALAVAGGPAKAVGQAHRSFSQPPRATSDDLNRRLLSLSSDNRADYWRVAWQETARHPLLGGGAGSFARYWLLLRPTGYDTQNAHNLYLETLAELGPVGLAFLLAVFALPFAAARRARGHPAVTAGAAAFAAYAVHAAVDWDFQLVVISLAALFCAAAVLVSARGGAREQPLPPTRRWVGAAGLAAAAALAVVAQVGNSALQQSRTALDRDDPARAAQLARRAERWQPWSVEPLEALGEAELASGRPAAARARLRHALARDGSNASLWLELADASSGPARSRALARARQLDPRSPA